MSTARLQRETSHCNIKWRTWTPDDKFSFLYFNMDKALKISTPGNVTYIWQIEQFQKRPNKVWKDANSLF